MHQPPSLAETCEQILREQEPNFLRLYLNPHVAQTCFCLDRYVRTTWPEAPALTRHKHARAEDCQSFLANGFEEALSGAIKLARYNNRAAQPASTGLILDPADRLTGFARAELAGGCIAQFLPGLCTVGKNQLGREPGTLSLETLAENGQTEIGAAGVDPLVLVAGALHLLEMHRESIRRVVRQNTPLVITCVDRVSLAALRGGSSGILHEIVPDIVVFDESFADHAVPWSAFTARKSLFACWNRPGKATFHSTTFQPNTVSTLHFMRCLAQADPDFHHRYRDVFAELLTDLSRRGEWFRRYYNPSLYRLIRTTGFDTGDIRAAGSFVVVDGRPIFDAVSGVACSFRGHNPATYGLELKTLDIVPPQENRGQAAQSADPNSATVAELRSRLFDLTGLEFFVPAVSGATAVENALKVALVAQFPKRHILALKAGFGGKTLLALTGTANPSYKERLDPLYADVHYVDAFAPDALAQIESLLETYEFAVVQVELIQGVGGVRRIPENVIRQLDAGRKRWGYLLLVDEVQTGMYRTGPFIFSQSINVTPDILLLGKATTDMMFPFALTLYSATVQAMLDRHGSDLIDSIKQRYGYEHGYKTVVNVLRQSEERGTSGRVALAGALFADLLKAGLASSKIVREVRVFGLLIGIELDTRRWPHRWLQKRLSSFYLFSMLRHQHCPVLAGFCQYEPNVLKITPPLNASPDEIRQACATIVDVLRRPLRKVLAAGLGGLISSSSAGRRNDEHGNDSALEPAAR
ncbi:MAG: aminotransferase class III-fold pyridoxal phosphate-dependent enzyme [Isosphaeraceae bacterium]